MLRCGRPCGTRPTRRSSHGRTARSRGTRRRQGDALGHGLRGSTRSRRRVSCYTLVLTNGDGINAALRHRPASSVAAHRSRARCDAIPPGRAGRSSPAWPARSRAPPSTGSRKKWIGSGSSASKMAAPTRSKAISWRARTSAPRSSATCEKSFRCPAWRAASCRLSVKLRSLRASASTPSSSRSPETTAALVTVVAVDRPVWLKVTSFRKSLFSRRSYAGGSGGTSSAGPVATTPLWRRHRHR